MTEYPGVKVFAIAGRMTTPRQRCQGMTEIDRQWRAQFLKDQTLSENEPRYVPEYYKSTTNFFRRLWKTPMNNFEKALQPLMGKMAAYYTRHFVSKFSIAFGIACICTYHIKYHSNDWTKKLEWRYHEIRDTIYPDDPNYPNFREKTPQEYTDDGFSSSPYAIKIERPPSSSNLRHHQKTYQMAEDKKVVCEK